MSAHGAPSAASALEKRSRPVFRDEAVRAHRQGRLDGALPRVAEPRGLRLLWLLVAALLCGAACIAAAMLPRYAGLLGK